MLDPYYEYSYDHPGPPSCWQTIAGLCLCIPKSQCSSNFKHMLSTRNSVDKQLA